MARVKGAMMTRKRRNKTLKLSGTDTNKTPALCTVNHGTAGNADF